MAKTQMDKRIERIVKKFTGVEYFGNKDIQELLSVGKSVAGKILNEMKDRNIIEPATKRGKYVIASAEEAEETTTEESTVEVENTTPEVEKSDEKSKKDSYVENCTQVYDVYLNGSFISSMEDTIDNIVNEIRGSYPGAMLDSVDGNELNFKKQKGSKG